MKEKVALRAHFRNLLRENSQYPESPEYQDRSKRLTIALSDYLKSQPEGTWATYYPLPEEPDPRQALASSSHIDWVFPRIDGSDLRFYSTAHWGTGEKNSWGVMEPKADPQNEHSVQDLDGFLVPGLAFDRRGARLGRGRGYFDRILTGHKGKKVGLAYSFQVSPSELPVEAHDVCMDLVVTENGVVK